MGESGMSRLWRLRLGAARHVREIAVKRLGNAVEQLGFVENVEHAETVCRRGCDRQRQSTAAPPRKAPADGVDGADVQARCEEDLEQLRELELGHSAKRSGDETRGTATDQNEADIATLHPR